MLIGPSPDLFFDSTLLEVVVENAGRSEVVERTIPAMSLFLMEYELLQVGVILRIPGCYSGASWSVDLFVPFPHQLLTAIKKRYPCFRSTFVVRIAQIAQYLPNTGRRVRPQHAHTF